MPYCVTCGRKHAPELAKCPVCGTACPKPPRPSNRSEGKSKGKGQAKDKQPRNGDGKGGRKSYADATRQGNGSHASSSGAAANGTSRRQLLETAPAQQLVAALLAKVAPDDKETADSLSGAVNQLQAATKAKTIESLSPEERLRRITRDLSRKQASLEAAEARVINAQQAVEEARTALETKEAKLEEEEALVQQRHREIEGLEAEKAKLHAQQAGLVKPQAPDATSVLDALLPSRDQYTPDKAILYDSLKSILEQLLPPGPPLEQPPAEVPAGTPLEGADDKEETQEADMDLDNDDLSSQRLDRRGAFRNFLNASVGTVPPREGTFLLRTINSNCWKTTLEVLDSQRADLALPFPAPMADVTFLQETRLATEDAFKLAGKAAGRLGYTLLGGLAEKTGEDPRASSAGVGVLVRDTFPANRASDPPLAEHPSRIAAASVDIGLNEPLSPISAYLYDGEGLSIRNVDILGALVAFILALEGPWVLAADFNIEPSSLEDTGFLATVKGVIVAPPEPICHAKAKGSMYDYFVVPEILAPFVSRIANGSAACFPHQPVDLTLQGLTSKASLSKLIRPRGFPTQLPVGCSRPPLVHTWSWPEGTQPADFAASYREWLRNTEKELCHTFDIVEPDEVQQHLGREQGFQLTTVLVTTQARRNARKILSQEGHAWNGLANHFARACAAAQGARDNGRGFAKAAAATAKLRAFTALCDDSSRTLSLPLPLDDAELFANNPRAKIQLAPEGALDTKASLQIDLRGLERLAIGTAEGQKAAVQQALRDILAKHRRQAAVEAKEAFKTWALAAVQGGGKAAHRYINDVGHGAACPSNEQGRPLGAQDSLETILKEWLPRWCDASRETEEPSTWDIGGDDLEPLTLELLDVTLRSYPEITGLGMDNLNPRSLLFLPTAFKQRILDLLHRFESRPEVLIELLTLFCFIPKDSGGVRPIGLLIALVRIWSRMRSKTCAEWEKANDHKFFVGKAGRTCEKSGWEHNIVSAYARAKGLDVITFIADLAKFYEHIRHRDLLLEAKATGFNLKLLRALCCIYGGFRAATFRGATSGAVRAYGTVIAGCSCATSLSKLLLLRALKDIDVRFPVVTVRNLVDDVTIQAVGPTKTVLQEAAGASTAFLKAVGDKHLPTSSGKTVVLASNKLTGHQFVKLIGLKPACLVDAARMLGTDATAKRRRKAHTCVSRRRLAKAKGSRLLHLQAAGAKIFNVHRAGPTCARLWGSEVLGLPTAELKTDRKAAAHAFGQLPPGASIPLALGAADPAGKFDPLLLYVQKVVATWAEAVWCGRPSLRLLDETLAAAAPVKTGGRHTAKPSESFKDESSPATPYRKVLASLGWAAASARHITTVGGHCLDLLRLAPKAVAKLARLAARDASDIAALSSDIAGAWVAPICWEPLRKLLASSKALSPREQGGLKRLIVNTVWSDTRRFKHGIASSSGCLACGDPDGSLWHRFYACPACEAFRRQEASPALIRAAGLVQAFSPPSAERFARGILPEPRAVLPRRPWEAEAPVFWVNRPPDGYLRGTIFSDGSGLHPTTPALRSAGWSLAATDQFGNVIAAAYGPVPLGMCPGQTARDGEDFAIRMTALLVAPPFEVYTDCLGTVRCMTQPAFYSTGPHNPRAHLWGFYHATFEEGDVTVHKTLGHATLEDVERGKSTHWERKGNAAADALAKKGAAAHAFSDQQVGEYLALCGLARQAAIFAARSHAKGAELWRELADEDVSRPGFRHPGNSFAPEPIADVDEDQPGHDLGALLSIQRRCPPCAASSGLELATSNGHALLAADVIGEGSALVFCSTCGAYYEKAVRSLALPCPGPIAPGLTSQRKRLADGVHPHVRKKHLRLDTPKALSPEQRLFIASLLPTVHSDEAIPGAAQAGHAAPEELPRASLLAAYGLSEGHLAELVARAQRRRSCSPAPLSEGGASEEEDGSDYDFDP